MPRFIRRLVACWLILAGTFVLLAQSDDPRPFLILDVPSRFELDGVSPQFFYYAGTAGEIITISMTRLANFNDRLNNPVLEIWDVTGKRMAYNDDRNLNDPDAQLRDIRLFQDGVYTIRADTYGGIYAGAFEIVIQPSDPFQRLETDDGVSFYLPANTIFEYSHQFEAGDVVTIIAQDRSQSLDPILAVKHPDGLLFAQNDDQDSMNLALDVLDAQLYRITIPQTGEYTIAVRDFLGRSGWLQLTIIHHAFTSAIPQN